MISYTDESIYRRLEHEIAHGVLCVAVSVLLWLAVCWLWWHGARSLAVVMAMFPAALTVFGAGFSWGAWRTLRRQRGES